MVSLLPKSCYFQGKSRKQVAVYLATSSIEKNSKKMVSVENKELILKIHVNMTSHGSAALSLSVKPLS